MTRIQIAVSGVLVGDEIVKDVWAADRVWSIWCENRYAQGKPLGSSIIQKAELPRAWDVAVGEKIELQAEREQRMHGNLCSKCNEFHKKDYDCEKFDHEY